MFRDEEPLDWEPDGNSSRCVVFGVTAKWSSISQEDKGFLGRQFKSVGKMAMQEMCQNKTCQVSVICSSLKISYFRIGYLDVNIHLWQAGRILKKIITYIIIVSSTCKYTTPFTFLQQLFWSLEFEWVPPVLSYSPVPHSVSLLHVWKNISDLKTLQLDWESWRGLVESDAKWK